jgi:DNA-directed RNA polymerase subunit RPC12/RpoP
MIHYTCDRCHRVINSEQEIRYTLRLESTAAIDLPEDIQGDDRNHLEELNEMLEQLEETERQEISESVYQVQRFDLCSECQRQFLKNPLGTEKSPKLQFSDN